MNIAIIPARSGSKSLPDKNIKLFDGIPLLAHSIMCAERSGLFSEIFVSTDSQHYADIAVQYGGSVPFLRDGNLAVDTTSMWDVVSDALIRYERKGKIFEMVTLLQPTSPLRTPDDVISANGIFNEKNADRVISVCKTDYAPYMCNTIPENGSLYRFIEPDKHDMQRQQFPDYYRINGAVYMVRCNYPVLSWDIYGESSYSYVMPKERSVDIDDEWDFLIAETIFKELKAEKEVS